MPMKMLALVLAVCISAASPAWADCLSEGQKVTTPEGQNGTVTSAFCDQAYERYTVELSDGTSVDYEAEITDDNVLPTAMR